MKQIYYKTVTNVLRFTGRKGEIKTLDGYSYCKMVYADNPENEELVVTELSEKDCYTRRNKKYIMGWTQNNFFGSDVRADTFVSFTKVTSYEKAHCSYSLEYLMRELDSEDMIEYLKDGGIANCPMMK